MVLKNQIAKGLQGAFHRSYLDEDIPAVTVVIQHFADPI